MIKKILIAAALLAATTTPAQVVLDPGTFAPGTNATDAYAGVTLSSFSLLNPAGVDPFLSPGPWTANYAPVYSAIPFDSPNEFVTSVFASSPSVDIGYAPMMGGIPGSCFSSCPGEDVTPLGRPDGFGTNLLIAFASPVYSVSVLTDGNSTNGVDMEAFNASNQFLGNCVEPGVSPPVQAVGKYGCYSVLHQSGGDYNYVVQTSLSGGGISKILIGGYNNGVDISTIQYTAAPEIDASSAAAALTLLLGGLMVVRGRRQTRPAA